ncbi:hypothetical protein KBX50_04760 [Micromonospora sp. C51]|uniref:hypothetical protein n=1 Tax=Micromonospora sp. C51 TaxID=2824879 RepID=UPI001B373AC1|nr:hypothetical protein [Micromonospora sp. C51]MBQ1047800.1 hypothetical protein [Micromonospora sp. C51]
MTARFVNGVRVLADQDALSPLKAPHGQAVYWKQIRHLLLENETETYGCVHDSFTHPDAQQVLIHLRSCPAKPAKAGRDATQVHAAPPGDVNAPAPVGFPRTPQARTEPSPPDFTPARMPTRIPNHTNVPPSAGRHTNAGTNGPTAARYRRGVNAGPAQPTAQPTTHEEWQDIEPASPAPPPRPSAASREQVLKRLALVDHLEKENQRLREWGTNWKRRAQTAEAELNAWEAAVSGSKVRRNARRT